MKEHKKRAYDIAVSLITEDEMLDVVIAVKKFGKMPAISKLRQTILKNFGPSDASELVDNCVTALED